MKFTLSSLLRYYILEEPITTARDFAPRADEALVPLGCFAAILLLIAVATIASALYKQNYSGWYNIS